MEPLSTPNTAAQCFSFLTTLDSRPRLPILLVKLAYVEAIVEDVTALPNLVEMFSFVMMD